MSLALALSPSFSRGGGGAAVAALLKRPSFVFGVEIYKILRENQYLIDYSLSLCLKRPAGARGVLDPARVCECVCVSVCVWVCVCVCVCVCVVCGTARASPRSLQAVGEGCGEESSG